MQTEHPPVKKSTKRWWCLGLTILLVLLAAFYYIGGRASGTTEPWVWNRGDKPAARHIHTQVGFTTSTINSDAAWTAANSRYSCLDIASTAVRSTSEHPLSIACAEQIAEKLKTIPSIKQIKFAAHGPLIGKEEPLPPWVVLVDVGDLHEWIMPNRSLSGNIYVSFGVAAAAQPSMYGDDGVAPLVRFEHSATNKVHFTHTGISSQSAFYEKIAEALAKKAVETIAQEFDKLSRTLPTLPELPEAFYPVYREASEVPPIPGLVSMTTITDGRRLLLPHYSLVQIETNFTGTDDDFLIEIQTAMQADGWTGHFQRQGDEASGMLAHMRLTRGNETFYIFKERRPQRMMLNLIQRADSEPAPQPEKRMFLLERMEKMDRDSVFAAIQTLLDENVPVSALLPFTYRVRDKNNETARNLQEHMRMRLLELKASTPAEQLAAAEFFEQVGDTETAKELLFKAWRIRQLSAFPKSDSDYIKLAKELEVEAEMKVLPPPTTELCEEFGFVLLSPENCPMEVDVEVNKEARFVAIANDGQLSLLQFTVRDESGTYHTESLQTTFRPHGSSWNSTKTSSSHFANHLWLGDQEGTFYFSLVSESPPSPDKPIRVRIEFR